MAFQQNNCLAWYATSVFYKPEQFPYNLAKFAPPNKQTKILSRLKRRYHPELNPELVQTFGLSEWLETAAVHVGARKLAAAIDRKGNDLFGIGIGRLLTKRPVDLVWGYNNSSFVAFKAAKQLGIVCVLDQTIGHPKALEESLGEQHFRFPEFFFSSPQHRSDLLQARNEGEMDLADLIVVGSEFCRSTIPVQYQEKTITVSYGHNLDIDDSPRTRQLGVPKFIFVGSVGPRKGIPQLLKAFSSLNDIASLTILGPIDCPKEALTPYFNHSNITFLGGVPRSQVEAHIRNADYFIFPSLFEGGGIVLYEAAAVGLPIVQSRFCGDGCDGTNGTVLSDVSSETISEAVQKIVQLSPDEYRRQSENSLKISRSRRWLDYRRNVFQAANDIFTKCSPSKGA